MNYFDPSPVIASMNSAFSSDPNYTSRRAGFGRLPDYHSNRMNFVSCSNLGQKLTAKPSYQYIIIFFDGVVRYTCFSRLSRVLDVCFVDSSYVLVNNACRDQHLEQ